MPSVLIDKLKQKAANATADYAQLVRDAAGGQDVDPDHAADVLEAAGKSADELARDIGKRTRRIDLRAVLDDADRRKKVLTAAEQAVAKLASDRAAAERKLAAERQAVLAGFDAKAAEADARRAAASDDVAAIASARKELAATAAADLIEAADSAESRSSFAYRQLRELEPRIARLAANQDSPTFAAHRELARLRAEAVRLTADAEAASVEADELNRQRLDP